MDSYPFNIPPLAFGAPLPPHMATYRPGVIFPWFAADNRKDAKGMRAFPPEGWEYTGRMVKLKPQSPFNPEETGMKYVLYLRKV